MLSRLGSASLLSRPSFFWILPGLTNRVFWSASGLVYHWMRRDTGAQCSLTRVGRCFGRLKLS